MHPIISSGIAQPALSITLLEVTVIAGNGLVWLFNLTHLTGMVS